MIQSKDYVGEVEWRSIPIADLPDCPFCGRHPTALIGGKQTDDWWSFVVHCDECGADGPAIAQEYEDDAVELACEEYKKRAKVLRHVVVHR